MWINNELQVLFSLSAFRFGKAGIAINLVDGPKSMKILREIEAHFGKPIIKLDAENVAELEQLES